MRQSTGVGWTETQSRSFEARHEEEDTEAVVALLETLEDFRSELAERFERMPHDVTVVVHSRPYQLTLAQPWLPLARAFAAPAARRYFAGWFSSREIHVLSASTLEERASRVAGSREALRLTPLHEYTHLVVGANNAALPPPFTPGSFRRYLRWAWLCEGAASFFSWQVDHLRPAISRRLREGPKPAFPPSARDAPLLGGTLYTLLEETVGEQACVDLVSSELHPGGARAAIETAFGRPFLEVEHAWRDHIVRP
jgi:hypothetical protein